MENSRSTAKRPSVWPGKHHTPVSVIWRTPALRTSCAPLVTAPLLTTAKTGSNRNVQGRVRGYRIFIQISCTYNRKLVFISKNEVRILAATWMDQTKSYHLNVCRQRQDICHRTSTRDRIHNLIEMTSFQKETHRPRKNRLIIPSGENGGAGWRKQWRC